MAGQKKVCKNCNRKFNNNELLVKHMQSSTVGCEKFVLKCSGCGKYCASNEHLQNHIRQAQKQGFRCYDVTNKMDIVSTLELSNLNSTKESISESKETTRGIKNLEESDFTSLPSAQSSQLLFAVKQKVPVPRNHISTSIDTYYGLDKKVTSTTPRPNNFVKCPPPSPSYHFPDGQKLASCEQVQNLLASCEQVSV